MFYFPIPRVTCASGGALFWASIHISSGLAEAPPPKKKKQTNFFFNHLSVALVTRLTAVICTVFEFCEQQMCSK